MAAVVFPSGNFDGVAFGGEDDVGTLFDAHAVGGYLEQPALLVVDVPDAVAVFLIVIALSQQMAFLVVGLVLAEASWVGVGVPDFQGSVGVVVVECASFLAVDKIAFEDAAAVLVGLDPVALSAIFGKTRIWNWLYPQRLNRK